MVCPRGQKKSDRCSELAVVETRWPLEEVQLYTHSLDTTWRKTLKCKMRIWENAARF